MIRPEDCMRTISQSMSTRLLSSLQVYKVPSLGRQHRQGSHRIQAHTNQHPQVPTLRLVPHVAQYHLNTIRSG